VGSAIFADSILHGLILLKIDKEIYETLLRRSKLLSGNYHVICFLLFSLNGFTKWFEKENIQNTVKITVEDLYI